MDSWLEISQSEFERRGLLLFLKRSLFFEVETSPRLMHDFAFLCGLLFSGSAYRSFSYIIYAGGGFMHFMHEGRAAW